MERLINWYELKAKERLNDFANERFERSETAVRTFGNRNFVLTAILVDFERLKSLRKQVDKGKMRMDEFLLDVNEFKASLTRRVKRFGFTEAELRNKGITIHFA